MSSSFSRRAVVCFCLGLFSAFVPTLFAQTSYYGTNGTEYAVVGSLPGDQVRPDAATGASGGYVVWQDNATDGKGWGISARKLDATLSGALSTFRVNVTASNDQENARVALLKNGGAVFVWQGGVEGFQHIYGRFLSPTNTFLTTTDVLFSVTNKFQFDPSVTVLNNSNVLVVWSSGNQAGSNSMQDVYGQLLSPVGQKVGTNFLINQFISFNQRTPAVAALKDGGFVVSWVSEQQRVVAPTLGNATTGPVYTNAVTAVTPSVDVFARLYKSNGVPVGSEFLVNSNLFPCANPAVAAGSDGGFMVVWGAHHLYDYIQSMDVYSRTFSSAGTGGAIGIVNSKLYGDQYAPRISSIGTDYLVVWTSLGQDGAREGVFGRFVHAGGGFTSDEFCVNTTTYGSQIHAVPASDGLGQFVVIWSSYAGSPNSMDLFAQRYLNVASLLSPMNAPFVYAPFVLTGGVYQPRLQVSWPQMLGISVSNYEVYVDGNALAAGVTISNGWTMTVANGLTTNSTHSFKVDYVTTTGNRSPLSPATSGSTWSGLNWSGIPFEWMVQYFGSDVSHWPSPAVDSDGDGVPNGTEFSSGTNPTDPNSILRQQLVQTAQGMFLAWNTQPGSTYQVQMTTNLVSWNNFGLPRFASGTNDSVNVGGNPTGYYRIQLQR